MNSCIAEIEGKAFCLSGDDIDTDRIIPARYLKCVTFDSLGEHVFEDDRSQLQGRHPFDQLENKGKSILVVGANFASGSSREHAVPALMQWGITAIIGLSFSAIFRGNAVGNGLVCVDVTPENHQLILSALERGHNEFWVNLEEQSISYCIRKPTPWLVPGLPCTMPESHRDMLITGQWDSLAIALEAGDLIEETAGRLPYITMKTNS